MLVTGASGGIGSACARAFAAEDANVLVHYHRGEKRARALADELAAHGRSGRPDLRGGCRAALRGGTSRAWPDRRLRRRRRSVAEGGRAGLAADARALGGDAAREPHGDLPRVASLPSRDRAERSRLARPRRLDRRRVRRGRARGLRGREVRDHRRPPALAEERDRAHRTARPRERGRAGLDRVSDDARARRRRAGPRSLAHDGAAQGRAARRTSPRRSSSSPPTRSPATSPASSSSSPVAWKDEPSTPTERSAAPRLKVRRFSNNALYSAWHCKGDDSAPRCPQANEKGGVVRRPFSKLRAKADCRQFPAGSRFRYRHGIARP